MQSQATPLLVDAAFDRCHDQRRRGNKNSMASPHSPNPISHALLIKWTKLWNEGTGAFVGLPLASTRDPHLSVTATVAQVMSLLLILTSRNFQLYQLCIQASILAQSKNIHSFNHSFILSFRHNFPAPTPPKAGAGLS